MGAGDREEAEASRPNSEVLGVGSTTVAALGFAFALLRSHDSALRFARSRTTGFQYEESWPWPWRYSTSGSAGSPTQRRKRRPTLRGRAVGKVGNAARQWLERRAGKGAALFSPRALDELDPPVEGQVSIERVQLLAGAPRR